MSEPYDSRQAFEADYPNIKGTGIRDDGSTDHPVLVVLVTKKVAEADLDESEIVPETVEIDGQRYTTDLEPVSIPHLTDTAPETTPADHQDRHRPILGGTSIGNANVGAGTVGSPLLIHEPSGDPVVLTNAHVTSGAEYHYQPASMDGGAESEPFGTLKDESELDPSTTQRTDSALIDVDRDTVSDVILGIGTIDAFGEPVYSQTHRKAGRTTAVTEAELKARDVEVDVAYGSQTIRFVGMDLFGYMSDPGDSGSIIGRGEDVFTATNLLFAGSDKVTIGIPLTTVQEYHGSLALPENEDDGDDDDDNGGDQDPIEWGKFHHPTRLIPEEHVVDGDTLDFPVVHLGLSTIKTNERIRLLGIDTAELNSPDEDERELAKEQTQFVIDWLVEGIEQYDGDDGYPFVLHTHNDEYDSFGRLLTHVLRRSDGASLADALIEEYGEDVKYDIDEQLRKLL